MRNKFLATLGITMALLGEIYRGVDAERECHLPKCRYRAALLPLELGGFGLSLW